MKRIFIQGIFAALVVFALSMFVVGCEASLGSAPTSSSGSTPVVAPASTAPTGISQFHMGWGCRDNSGNGDLKWIVVGNNIVFSLLPSNPPVVRNAYTVSITPKSQTLGADRLIHFTLTCNGSKITYDGYVTTNSAIIDNPGWGTWEDIKK